MTTLFSKEGFQLIKRTDGRFFLTFEVTNPHIFLSNLVDFSLIELIYRLNEDIYQDIHFERHTNQEASLCLVMKHLFKDLGLPQRFSNVLITKETVDGGVVFHSKSIYDNRPSYLADNLEQTPVDMTCRCTHLTPHTTQFDIDFVFLPHFRIPTFLEKLVGTIVYKIFKRVKQFIENIRI